MGHFYNRLAVVVILLLQFTAIVSAGTLDDYYLQQFGEAKSIQLQKAVLSGASEVTAQCGMPLKRSLRRDWTLLEPSTQKTLTKMLVLPVLSNEYLSNSGHFKIHYDLSGVNAPNISVINHYTGLGLTNVGEWIKIVADTFDYVYATYSSLGYQTAPTIGGAPYDIYLHDLASRGFYGTVDNGSSVASSSYPHGVASSMELDSSFIDGSFLPDTFSPLQSLQITAAHEYHHAIQFGYNVFFETWYAEATSTWMEDELYDNVNQLYNYLPNYFAVTQKNIDMPIGGRSEYGRWIFNRYLSEQHTAASILNFWETLAQTSPPCSNPNVCEIAMVPIIDNVLTNNYGTSLSVDFFNFAKRIYKRNWTDHSYDIGRIHAYMPIATYSTYPINITVTNPASPKITLPHYSFAYYKFTPTSGVSSLSIYINKSTGIQTALYKSGSEVTVKEVKVNSDGTSTETYTTTGLGTADEVVLLIANTTSVDGHNANFSTDGSLVEVTEPATPSSSVSGGSGCFIATAAYGSYLHPHVQGLRHFRDRYLLTNAAGRSFVALYYHCSPPMADFIARHPFLRGMTRMALIPLVAAVIHPLYSVAFLIVFGTAALIVRQRRISTILAHADQAALHVPSSHI
ncbi:MAG: hypothetical protein A2076_16230 [Geobacteraceae bacterium GWC2_53_11]|nr:MAG: hypothetical protein A2076_16230 [Geobacteraceae bacterium GWC2_53_11]